MEPRSSRSQNGNKNQSKDKKRKIRKSLNLKATKEKLKRSLDSKDCYFGVYNSTKFNGITITCSKFSIIFKIKTSFVAIFVTPETVYILDSQALLLKKTFPQSVFQFINSLATKRRMILTKLKSSVKCILKICFHFLILLYKKSSVDTIISLLNLIVL